jgi:hypothetical protein
MSLIGGTAIKGGYYWSSSQYNINYSWVLQWLYDGLYGNDKYDTYYVRAFAAL